MESGPPTRAYACKANGGPDKPNPFQTDGSQRSRKGMLIKVSIKNHSITLRNKFYKRFKRRLDSLLNRGYF